MTTPSRNASRLSQLLAEMKRRHVVRFALGYAAAAFVVLQLAEIVFPAFGLGETGLRVLVVAVALLFPPAMVLAWIFDVTPQGIERTPETPGATRGRLLPGALLLVITVVMVGGVGIWLEREGVLDRTDPRQGRRSQGVAAPALVSYEAGMPIRSIAVLPLDDFSGDDATDYFTRGMQEELIAQLSQLPGLRVVSRTSVQRYAGTQTSMPIIGRDLQVDAIIEGSVRRSDDQVRITVQLIHAASDTHIWTQQYDRPLDNVLTLQGEVALDIAKQIQAELSAEETEVLQQVAARTVDPEAQDAYLRGRFEAEKGTPDALAAAKDLFETAVEEDSSFAPALAGLAGTRFLLGLADPTGDSVEVARAAAEAQRAIFLDSASLEAREVYALIRENLHRSPAAPTPPDTAWFQALSQIGRQIEFRVRGLRDREGQSLPAAQVGGARQLMAAGLFQEAVDLLADLSEQEQVPDMAWDLLARAHVAAGDPEGAVDAVEEWHRRGAEQAPDARSVEALRSAVADEGVTGYWRWNLARLENRAAKGSPASPLELAAAHAGVGDVEAALESLQDAVDQRDRGLAGLQKEPVWDVLRGDPRFAEITRRARSIHLDSRARGAGGPGGPR